MYKMAPNDPPRVRPTWVSLWAPIVPSPGLVLSIHRPPPVVAGSGLRSAPPLGTTAIDVLWGHAVRPSFDAFPRHMAMRCPLGAPPSHRCPAGATYEILWFRANLLSRRSRKHLRRRSPSQSSALLSCVPWSWTRGNGTTAGRSGGLRWGEWAGGVDAM